MTSKKKLIEVALPLEAINKASAREKSIRHGHPSTLHLWWARRPLAAARAVIFAQMVDDPSAHPDIFKTEKAQEKERQRLFKIIEDLVRWENTTNEEVLQRARDEIWQSWRRTCKEHEARSKERGPKNPDSGTQIPAPRYPLPASDLFNPDKLPAFHDPFAGGGSIPLEAQRLGLEAYASDLNPVAVLINKAMIEIPPKFAGKPPVHPETEARSEKRGARIPATRSLLPASDLYRGAQGLAEDVRYYGQWMRDEAEKRIGHLYPKIEITAEVAEDRKDLKPYVGKKLTVIAWLWARTVKSPNPAFAQVDVPLASTFMLSTKAGKEAYVEPVIDAAWSGERVARSGEQGDAACYSLPAPSPYRFTVKVGKPKNAEAVKNGTKLSRGANFRCVMSGTPIDGDYIKTEGKAGRMGARLMAIVAEGDRGRVYLAPTPEHEVVARKARPEWRPEGDVPARLTGGTCVPYGLTTWGDLFTPRQLVALTTFSDLVGEAMERIRHDALAAGLPDDPKSLRDGGTGAAAYAEAVVIYLAFAQSKACNRNTSLCLWEHRMDRLVATFGRQALPMVWDYAETNPLAGAGGDIFGTVQSVREVLDMQFGYGHIGEALQIDAVTQNISRGKLISTDPPYYDNIGYADLSDFFYVWLRRSLRSVFPDLFVTLAVPKAEELVATPHRHGSKERAEAFFLDGMTQAMHRLVEQAHPAFPATIYYAFKQSETESETGTASTGWETFLDAVVRAGFGVSGTWPMRTEQPKGLRAFEQNALASSIVLVCRQRGATAPTATRRDFLNALKAELPNALLHLQRGNIAPVDLAQAAIGPGMAVFTRYDKVLDAEGKPVSVREALALINQTLDAVLAEQEGDFDADSRWALAWFEQTGFSEGQYGVAETLSKAKNTSVEGMVRAEIVQSKGGKVRLLKPDELPKEWDPTKDHRVTVWEMVH